MGSHLEQVRPWKQRKHHSSVHADLAGNATKNEASWLCKKEEVRQGGGVKKRKSTSSMTYAEKVIKVGGG